MRQVARANRLPEYDTTIDKSILGWVPKSKRSEIRKFDHREMPLVHVFCPPPNTIGVGYGPGLMETRKTMAKPSRMFTVTRHPTSSAIVGQIEMPSNKEDSSDVVGLVPVNPLIVAERYGFGGGRIVAIPELSGNDLLTENSEGWQYVAEAVVRGAAIAAGKKLALANAKKAPRKRVVDSDNDSSDGGEGGSKKRVLKDPSAGAVGFESKIVEEIVQKLRDEDSVVKFVKGKVRTHVTNKKDKVLTDLHTACKLFTNGSWMGTKQTDDRNLSMLRHHKTEVFTQRPSTVHGPLSKTPSKLKDALTVFDKLKVGYAGKDVSNSKNRGGFVMPSSLEVWRYGEKGENDPDRPEPRFNAWRSDPFPEETLRTGITVGFNTDFYVDEDGNEKSVMEAEDLDDNFWRQNDFLPTAWNSKQPGPFVDMLFVHVETRRAYAKFVGRNPGPKMVELHSMLDPISTRQGIASNCLDGKSEMVQTQGLLGDNSLNTVARMDTAVTVMNMAKKVTILHGGKVRPGDHQALFEQLLPAATQAVLVEIRQCFLAAPGVHELEVRIPFCAAAAQDHRHLLNAERDAILAETPEAEDVPDSELAPNEKIEDVEHDHPGIKASRARFDAMVESYVPTSQHKYDWYLEGARMLSKANYSHHDRLDYLWVTPEFMARYCCSWIGSCRDGLVGQHDHDKPFLDDVDDIRGETGLLAHSYVSPSLPSASPSTDNIVKVVDSKGQQKPADALEDEEEDSESDRSGDDGGSDGESDA